MVGSEDTGKPHLRHRRVMLVLGELLQEEPHESEETCKTGADPVQAQMCWEVSQNSCRETEEQVPKRRLIQQMF